MKNVYKLFIFALIITFSLISCSNSDEDALKGEVSIAGSSTVYPITAAFAEEFSRSNPGVTVPVQSTGTGGGFENFFLTGKTDINNASRRIKSEEKRIAEENNINYIELKIAKDAVTVIVSKENNWINNISTKELKNIWNMNSSIEYWDDVRSSFPHKDIILYGPTPASGTFDFFTEFVVGDVGRSRDDYNSTEQDNTIIQAVSRDDKALAYLGFAYYINNDDKVKALSINGSNPSFEAAKNGTYPLSRYLYIYVNTDSLRNEAVRKFLLFYINELDSDIINQVGYPNISKEEFESQKKKLLEAIDNKK